MTYFALHLQVACPLGTSGLAEYEQGLLAGSLSQMQYKGV